MFTVTMNVSLLNNIIHFFQKKNPFSDLWLVTYKVKHLSRLSGLIIIPEVSSYSTLFNQQVCQSLNWWKGVGVIVLLGLWLHTAAISKAL